MAQALTDAGVPVHLGVEVSEVLRRSDGAVVGVATGDGERARAPMPWCAPSTCRSPTTGCLPGVAAPRAVRAGDYSPSARRVARGRRRGCPGRHLRHHNIHFGRQWGGAFEALIDRGVLMPDPSRLVTVPSRHRPHRWLPPGHTTLYVLEPVPHTGGGVDWRAQAGPMRERLHGFLQQAGYPTDIPRGAARHPAGLAGRGHAPGHAVRPGAHVPAVRAVPAVATSTARVPGLVFAGSGTQPGVGIPMVLVSGKLAAQRVQEYLAAPRTATVVR